MAAIFIFTTALFVLVPVTAVVIICLYSRDFAEKRDDTQVPTVLNVGRRDVLRALDNGDVDGARRAFLAMSDACGFCSKLPRGAGAR